MIIFDQLRVSDNGKRLYIDIHVNKASHFENIYLESVTIMTADQVSETSPHLPTSDYIYKKEFKCEHKKAHLVLTATDFNENFKGSSFGCNLFFVYVSVKGTPGPCTPCRLDEKITLGVTFDENLLHQKVMQFTKSLADTCRIPREFIDFILQWNAFKSAIETEHYIPAIKFYNQLFGKGCAGDILVPKPCGCHG